MHVQINPYVCVFVSSCSNNNNNNVKSLRFQPQRERGEMGRVKETGPRGGLAKKQEKGGPETENCNPRGARARARNREIEK